MIIGHELKVQFERSQHVRRFAAPYVIDSGTPDSQEQHEYKPVIRRDASQAEYNAKRGCQFPCGDIQRERRWVAVVCVVMSSFHSQIGKEQRKLECKRKEGMIEDTSVKIGS